MSATSDTSHRRSDKRVSATKLVDSILRLQGATQRAMFESEMKTANYEAMMHRFQLRRLSSHVNGAKKLHGNAVAMDKYLESSMPKRPTNSQRFSVTRFTRKLSKKALRSSSSLATVILPRSRLATIHGLVMLGAFHFQVFYLPFAPVFFPSGSPATRITNLTLEVVFLLNIVFHFNLAYIENKATVTSRHTIARHYAQSWLLVDLVSAMPIQIFRQMLGTQRDGISPVLLHNSILIVFRLLRLSFSGRIFVRQALGSATHLAAWINYSRYSHLVGIVRLLWFVLVIAHYMACFWHLLDRDQPLPNQSIAEKYIANYYYAVILIHGQGEVSDHWSQNLFSSVLVLVGSVIVATIFGNVAMLVSNFNASATNYQRKMEGVYATMEKMELPDRLRERIQQYYAHVWTEYESLDGDLVKFQHELTHTLGLEVGLYKYMSLVNDIPFWVDCSPDFIAQIVLMLVVRVYLPDDYVVRQGEICDEMFMVNRGVCEKSSCPTKEERHPHARESDDTGASNKYPAGLSSGDSLQDFMMMVPRRNALSSRSLLDSSAKAVYSGRVYPKADTHKALKTLYPGESFSEMSLLMNYKQPSSVRAASFVELCVLQRNTFQRIIGRYPEDRRRVLSNMLKNCIEKREVPFPLEYLSRGDNNKPTREVMPWNISTPAEAAQLLVQQIDVDLPDESIKYGFQSLDTPTGQAPSYRNSKRGVSCCGCEGRGGSAGNNDTVIKMLQELAVTVNRIDEDVRELKSKQHRTPERSPEHNSKSESAMEKIGSTILCEGCGNQGAKRNGKSTSYSSIESSSAGHSLLSDRLIPRTMSPLDQLDWSHRGSARRVDVNPIESNDPLLVAAQSEDAETRTSVDYVAAQSPSVPPISSAPQPSAPINWTSEKLETLEPIRLPRMKLFSSRQAQQRPVHNLDSSSERIRSSKEAADATRILGEPDRRAASATALANQLWRLR